MGKRSHCGKHVGHVAGGIWGGHKKGNRYLHQVEQPAKNGAKRLQKTFQLRKAEQSTLTAQLGHSYHGNTRRKNASTVEILKAPRGIKDIGNKRGVFTFFHEKVKNIENVTL